jgi:hypothetical protein
VRRSALVIEATHAWLVPCIVWEAEHVPPCMMAAFQGRPSTPGLLFLSKAVRAQHVVVLVFVLFVCRVRAAGPQIGALLQGAAELALMLSAASSGIMGISVAVVELKRGARTCYCFLSDHHVRPLGQQPGCMCWSRCQPGRKLCAQVRPGVQANAPRITPAANGVLPSIAFGLAGSLCSQLCCCCAVLWCCSF